MLEYWNHGFWDNEMMGLKTQYFFYIRFFPFLYPVFQNATIPSFHEAFNVDAHKEHHISKKL